MGFSKSKKKKKRKLQMPPLSFLDRCIYYVGMLLSFGLMLALLFGYIWGFGHFVYQDPAIIGAEQKAGILWQLPFCLFVFLSGFVICEDGLICRKPIFGKKGVRYGPPQWAAVYPLLSKERKIRPTIENRPSHKQFRKAACRAWLIGFVITLLLYPLGFFGRYTLDQDCVIRDYNCLNTEVGAYGVDEMSGLTVGVVHYRNGRSWIRHWKLRLSFDTHTGETFSFDFGSGEASLELMQSLKARFPADRIRYEGTQNINKLINDQDIPPQLWDSLYELFELTEGDAP